MPILDTKPALLLVLLVLLAVPSLALVQPGRITVYSTPTGALACVDTSDCDTTGATFAATGNAWHNVTITLKGYKPWTDRVYVTADQISMVNAYLDLDPDLTAVQVSVSPGGGTVCLDNLDCRANVGTAGSTGSTKFSGVSEGYHTISVESPAGYEDTTKLVQVNLGKVTDVTIDLVPFVVPTTAIGTVSRKTGTIRVYVDRTGSTICIDDGDCFVNVGGTPGPGTGTSIFNEVLAEEQHIITIAADGYRPVSTKVTVGADQISTVDIRLQPLGGATTLPTPDQTALVTEPPTMPTNRSGLDAVPVLGALVLCSAVLLFRKSGE